MLAVAPGTGLETRALTSTYFDTPDGALSRRHMSLRLREDFGGVPVQTFKCGQGLSRQELEWSAPGGLNLKHAELRVLLKAPLRKALVPVFKVTIHRRQRTFDYKGARIELALDQGEVCKGDQRRPICEVELELKAGSRADLFDLAQVLSKAAPLRLSFLGKASQGQMLLQHAPSFSQDTSLALTRDTLLVDAFQTLAHRAIVDLALHAEAYSEFGEPRALHALRVSTRRLKSYLATFDRLLDETGAKRVRQHLNWLLKVSAEARNIDVFAQTYLHAQSPAHLATVVMAAGAAAHARTRGVLASARFRGLLLDIVSWLETHAWRGRTDRANRALGGKIKRFARKSLSRRLESLTRRTGNLRTLDPEARHEVRLKIKRLRYVLEAFASLFASGDSAPYLRSLRAIQSYLGDLNDSATAEHLVDSLNLGDLEVPARRLVRDTASSLEQRVAASNRQLKRLLGQTPPWAT